MMETSLHLDGYTVDVRQTHTQAYAQLDNSHVLRVYSGAGSRSTLPVPDGTIILYGTPQQLWDIGMMLARGAQALIDKKAADEAAATQDISIVADAATESKEAQP